VEYRDPAEDEEAEQGEGALQENRSVQRWSHLPLTGVFALHHAGEVGAARLRKLPLAEWDKREHKMFWF